MMTLTQRAFTEFKQDYSVYGTHPVLDRYKNEQSVKDTEPRGVINTMWHPLVDASDIAEYGSDISRMFFGIIYEDPGIKHGDILTINNDEYEIVGIKYFNTHTRIDVRRKKV
jgi:hypothetical protein